jgi:diguanylate cyclase (GGDEF)-like protein
MKKQTVKEFFARLSGMAILSFLISLLLSSFLAGITIMTSTNFQKLEIEQLILEKAYRINSTISRLLYKTNSLAALVMYGHGTINDFQKLAPIIANEPVILYVLIAPGGIVTEIYPMSGGNDAVIGWDFFREGAGNNEAVSAIEASKLILAGPFTSVQGSEILSGRLPVFFDTPEEENKFWGLVSIGIKFPQVLSDAELDVFSGKGLSYELWRNNPDTGEKQVILEKHKDGTVNTRYIEKHIPISNTDWYLKVWPIRNWYNKPQNILLLVASLLVSFIVLFVMQHNHELKLIKSSLEDMAMADPLTGIFNRRHFMEIAQINLERARRQNEECFIILFDLDRFKNVNDTYGHLTGDRVLIETVARIKLLIRPYDLFARYGGEEFIIFASRIDKANVIEMVERLRLSICNKNFGYDGGINLNLTTSFGIAIIDSYDIKKAISNADIALYTAKAQGRNKTVYYEG